jgi:hypothetical protein
VYTSEAAPVIVKYEGYTLRQRYKQAPETTAVNVTVSSANLGEHIRITNPKEF